MRDQVQQLEQQNLNKDIALQKLEEKLASVQKVYSFLPHLKHLVATMEATNSHPTEQGDFKMNGAISEEDHFQLEPMNVSSLAKHYVTNHRSRNFSISDEDSDLETDNKSTTTTTKSSIQEETQTKDGKEKEYYL